MTHLLILITIIIIAWNLAPMLMLCTLPIPWRHKLRGCKSFAGSALRGLLVLPPDLLAPAVVPFALRQIGWGAESLPRWARWWDNDVSINGDHQVPAPLVDTPEIRVACYYAPGHHPRSFYARWVWLGLRNRASALAARLGHAMRPEDLLDADTWGDEATNRDHAGWCVRRNGPVYQLSIVRPIGAGLCLRVNTGHKLDLVRRWGRDVAIVVNITASVLRWKGAA